MLSHLPHDRCNVTVTNRFTATATRMTNAGQPFLVGVAGNQERWAMQAYSGNLINAATQHDVLLRRKALNPKTWQWRTLCNQ